MNENRNVPSPEHEPGDIRELPEWTRRYAVHQRGLTVVIGLLINLGVFAAIAGGSYVGGQAYRDGQVLVAIAGIGAAIVGCVSVLVTVFTSFGRQLPDRIAARFLIGDEGEANLSAATSSKSKPIALFMVVAFATCILAQVFLGDAIAVRFQQPVAALYMVPFLLSLWFLNRPASSRVQLLWPGLIALHAVLLLAGAPILFTGNLESLNFIVPVMAYGLVTHLFSHFYARIALRNVRRLSAVDGPSK